MNTKSFAWLLLALFAATGARAVDFENPAALASAAADRHPAIARLRAEASAARERIDPAAALPNPMVMGGVQNMGVDLTRDEMMTMVMVGASQTLVRPEKRDARRAAAEAAALTSEREVTSMRAEIVRDVLLAWYEIATIDGQLRTTTEVREMTDAIIAAARVRYEVGNAAQADVIRGQLQRSNLDRDILRLEGARRSAAARLLPLLGLPEDHQIPALTMPETTDDLPIRATALPPADHAAVEAIALRVEQLEQEIRLAGLETKPDIDLQAQYGFRPEQRDMFSLTARIELPFRRESTIQPRIREAVARRDAALRAVEEMRLALARELGEAAAAHEETTRQLELYQEVLVPQSRLAFDSTLAAYQTGKASFDAILATETDYLALRLEQLDLLARHAQAVVSYEALRKGARAGATISVPAAARTTSAVTSRSMEGM